MICQAKSCAGRTSCSRCHIPPHARFTECANAWVPAEVHVVVHIDRRSVRRAELFYEQPDALARLEAITADLRPAFSATFPFVGTLPKEGPFVTLALREDAHAVAVCHDTLSEAQAFLEGCATPLGITASVIVPTPRPPMAESYLRQKHYRPLTAWSEWFAWFPVQTDDKGWRWLRRVNYRKCVHPPTDIGPAASIWQYSGVVK